MKSVTVEKLFDKQSSAGLPPEAWLALSPAEQVIERLLFIRMRAEAIKNKPYDIGSGIPSNLWSLSNRLIKKVDHVLETIKDDFIGAYGLIIDIGMLVQEIKTLPALYSALKTWTVEVDTLENEVEDLKPHAKRGKKLSDASSMGGNERVKEFQQYRPKYQSYVNAAYQENKNRTYEKCRKIASAKLMEDYSHEVSPATIKKYTKNPKSIK